VRNRSWVTPGPSRRRVRAAGYGVGQAAASASSVCACRREEEAWIVPRAAAEGLSVQRFLVESALPEGRPSLLARRALCREFLAMARDFHGACVNLNQLTHLAHVRRDVPSGADEVMAEVRAGGKRIVELAALLSARGGGPPGAPEA
jgi:hypothetical protein